MKNNTKSAVVRSVGRPSAVLKFPRGIFTVAALAALNPDVVTLTIRNHIEAGLADKSLTLHKETVKTGKPGKPAHRFIKTSIWENLTKKRKANKPVVEVSLTETTPPVVTEVPAVTVEVPAEAVLV